jgi:hypothetical protein
MSADVPANDASGAASAYLPEAGAHPPQDDDPRAGDRTGADRASADRVAPDPTPFAFVAALREPAAQKGVLTAVVAWSLTVAPAAFARSSMASLGAVAIGALVAGLAGPIVAVSRPNAGRHVGITAFLALSVGVWVLAPASLDPARLEPIRAALGSLAWGLYALGWRGPKPAPTRPKPDPSAPALKARSALPRLAVPVASLGVLAAMACLAFAWRARTVERAAFAQGVAVACAVALVSASAHIATSRGRPRAPSRRVPPLAVRSLLLLAAVVVGGVAVLLLR